MSLTTLPEAPTLRRQVLTDFLCGCSIIRILFMVPVYSIVSWLSILFYNDSVYFEIIGDCYEAFCIAAFFSLMCHYIAPDLHSQKDYFRGIQPKSWLWPLSWFQKWKCCFGHRGAWRNPRSGLTWFNVRSIAGRFSNRRLTEFSPRLSGSVSFNTALCAC